MITSSRCRNRAGSRKSFTLAELLVVMLVLPLYTQVHNVMTQGRTDAYDTAAFVNSNIPQDQIIETWEQELAVLRLLAQNLTYRQIASQMVISLNTVRYHVKTIYGKLCVDKRAAAVDRSSTPSEKAFAAASAVQAEPVAVTKLRHSPYAIALARCSCA